MVKYEHGGETFQLDDSEGCYIKVTYRDMVGYVGVNLNDGTSDRPYSWSAPGLSGTATKDGVTGGGVGVGKMEDGLKAVCAWLIQRYREAEGRKNFKPGGGLPSPPRVREGLTR